MGGFFGEDNRCFYGEQSMRAVFCLLVVFGLKWVLVVELVCSWNPNPGNDICAVKSGGLESCCWLGYIIAF